MTVIIGLLAAQDLSSMEVSKTYSPNKKYCLEIIPKGFDNNDSGCLGNFYAADTFGNYQFKSSWILLNPIAPVMTLLSDDGSRVVTIDDWGADGSGDHVIVIYDSLGTIIRKFTLEDIAPKNEIQNMRMMDNKRIWHGDYSIVNNTLIIQTITNGEVPFLPGVEYRRVIIGLDDGKIISRAIDLGDMIIDDYVPVEVGAKAIKLGRPRYPELARRLEQQGLVYVKMLVDLDGTVLNVLVIKSSDFPQLDSAAVEAAYKSIFSPAQIQGKPVRVWVAAPIRFELE
jgi:TonB family protein